MRVVSIVAHYTVFIYLQVSQALCLQGCYGADLARPISPNRRQLVQDLSSSFSLQTIPVYSSAPYQSHTTTPCCGPPGHPDSPSAEWQKCCWGCAGAQLHASPSPGGRRSASSRSNSAQLGTVRGLRGMTRQSPD